MAEGTLSFYYNGHTLPAKSGQTIGTALLASGRRTLRHAPRSGAPRGLFCAMGACFECVVTVDGQPGCRACMTPVRDGMAVTT